METDVQSPCTVEPIEGSDGARACVRLPSFTQCTMVHVFMLPINYEQFPKVPLNLGGLRLCVPE